MFLNPIRASFCESCKLKRHAAWRLSLQDSQKEARIGFKNLEELTAFLEKWMKASSNLDSNQLQPKEKTK